MWHLLKAWRWLHAAQFTRVVSKATLGAVAANTLACPLAHLLLEIWRIAELLDPVCELAVLVTAVALHELGTELRLAQVWNASYFA